MFKKIPKRGVSGQLLWISVDALALLTNQNSKVLPGESKTWKFDYLSLGLEPCEKFEKPNILSITAILWNYKTLAQMEEGFYS